MGLCKDCKWIWNINRDPEEWKCSSLWKPVSLLTGNYESLSANLARAMPNLCGPSGAWFEPKEE